MVETSAAAAVAADLMQSDRIQMFHDHVLVKEPGTSITTPWHHDGPYYFVEGHQTVSFWSPLDPGREAEGFQIMEFDMQPGDDVAFHFRTLHGGRGDSPAVRSWGVFVVAGGRRCALSRAPASASDVAAAFPGHGMTAGQKLSEDWFPTILARQRDGPKFF